MMKFLCKCSDMWQSWAPFFLRIAAGLVFAAHGYQKWTAGMAGVGGFFASLGIPLVGFFAPFVTFLELIGGIALILGLLTHWFGKLFAVEMLVAFLLVHIKNGIFVQNGGYELVLMLFAASISLVITGSGRWSLDNMLFGREKRGQM